MLSSVHGKLSGVRTLGILAAVGLPLTLYLITLYPGLGDRTASGDAVEFQYVGRALSIPHEPGYPQYVLLTNLWSRIPLPITLATKINLFSALFAAGAGLLLLLAVRDSSRCLPAAVLAVWALLTAPDLWRLATQAEVYTLHVFWVSFFFWAALRWHRRPTRRALLLLLIGYALGFGNHLTMIALLPALGFLLVTRQPRLLRDPSAWAWGLGAAAIGASQYLLLVWRSYHPHPTLLRRFPLEADFAELLAYVTGDRFVDKHWLPDGLTQWAARAGEALLHGASQLTPWFAAFAAGGLVLAWRRRRAVTSFLLVAGGSVILFAAAYDIRDWLLYCIPAWLAATFFAAEGIGSLVERLPRWRLAIFATLALLLALRAVGGVADLRVASNPSDLEEILPALPARARVLPAGGHRLTRLIADYYRYGAEVETAEKVRFLSARTDLVERRLNLREQPLFFRSPTVANILRNRLIDFRPTDWSGRGGPLLVTGAEEPLTEIDLHPIDDSSFRLVLREEPRVLTDEKALYLLFVGGRGARSKGLEMVEPGDSDWRRRAREMIGLLQDDDVVVLMAPRLNDELRESVAEFLTASGLPAPPPTSRRLYAAWRRAGRPERGWLVADPTAAVTLDLGAL